MKPSLENTNTALIHDWLTVSAGGEKALLAIAELFPRAPIYTTVYDAKKVPQFNDREIRTSFLQKVPLAKKQREIVVPLAPLAFEQFDLSQYDLVISSNSMAAKGVITNPATPHICYCFTPSRYLWEPSLDVRADKGRFSGLRKNVAFRLRQWDRVAADRVDLYVAISDYVARRIKKYYQRDSIVISPPVDVERFHPAAKPSDYYIFISRLVDYKHPELVIQAFNELGLPLKVIGRGPMKPQLEKMARKNIEFMGYLSDEDLVSVYNQALAFVFPSEEDFGIVTVEALASGRPVIAYKEGGSAEIVENGTSGVLFGSQTVGSLVQAIKNFEPNSYNPEELSRRAQKYSKARFQQEFSAAVSDFLEKYGNKRTS